VCSRQFENVEFRIVKSSFMQLSPGVSVVSYILLLTTESSSKTEHRKVLYTGSAQINRTIHSSQ
jgi:hypothetical protein